MWAWYGVPYGPPASVRSTVAPGTFASAAALTFAATSAESASRSARAAGGVADGEAVPAAPATAEPPRPRAPSAATVSADLRMVLGMRGLLFIGGATTEGRPGRVVQVVARARRAGPPARPGRARAPGAAAPRRCR